MRTKYKINIEGLELFRFAEDKNLYKLPFSSNGKYYASRLIKKQDNNRWFMDGKPYSENQLRSKLIRETSNESIVLFEDIDDAPF